MTTIYFVRHAEPNYNNHDDVKRELSAKGLKDSLLVTHFLKDKNVDVVLSSPYKRAVDTICDFSRFKGFDIGIVENFRERKISNVWIEDFTAFSKKQWSDFSYKLKDGESLGEVQKRNIDALKMVLKLYKDKTVVVGSHGTALSTIINYYDNKFGYFEFEKIKKLMPWIVKFTFCDDTCLEIAQYNIFEQKWI